MNSNKTVEDFLTGKSMHTQSLFHQFINEYSKLGIVTLHPAKTMIGVDNGHKRIAWITQLGKILFILYFRLNSLILIICAFKKLPRCPAIINSLIISFACMIRTTLMEVIAFMKLALAEK